MHVLHLHLGFYRGDRKRCEWFLSPIRWQEQTVRYGHNQQEITLHSHECIRDKSLDILVQIWRDLGSIDPANGFENTGEGIDMSVEIRDDLCVVPALLFGGNEHLNRIVKFRMIEWALTFIRSTTSRIEWTAAAAPGIGRVSRTTSAILSPAVGRRCEPLSRLLDVRLPVENTSLSFCFACLMSATSQCLQTMRRRWSAFGESSCEVTGTKADKECWKDVGKSSLVSHDQLWTVQHALHKEIDVFYAHTCPQ